MRKFLYHSRTACLYLGVCFNCWGWNESDAITRMALVMAGGALLGLFVASLEDA